MVGGGDCLPSLKSVYLGSSELSSLSHVPYILFSMFYLVWFDLHAFLDGCHSITWSLFSWCIMIRA